MYFHQKLFWLRNFYFTFFNYNAHDMLHVIERSIGYYMNRKDIWALLQQRGMNGDYSWTHSADEYLKLYSSVFEEKKISSEPSTEEKNPVVMEFEE